MRARLLVATALMLATTAPVVAQGNLDGRIGKLEGEMRAVQRKVFPGGAGQYLQPEVENAPVQGPVSGVPSGSAVADLTARVSSLEQQVASLTGQVEQAGYRARQAQDAMDGYRRATDARLRALESAATPAPGASTAVDAAGSANDAPFLAGDVNSRKGEASSAPIRPGARSGLSRPTAAPAPARVVPPADLDHEQRLTGITKPDSGDAAEDGYVYGYRLWQAKLYPEAEAALKKAAADYPKARRFSYSQNLLGRTYLDDGKPSLASMAFYDNYKKMPDGERAPESLYYLAQALVKLNKPADACKVYDELTDVYAGKIGAKMKADVAAGRVTAKCK